MVKVNFGLENPRSIGLFTALTLLTTGIVCWLFGVIEFYLIFLAIVFAAIVFILAILKPMGPIIFLISFTPLYPALRRIFDLYNTDPTLGQWVGAWQDVVLLSIFLGSSIVVMRKQYLIHKLPAGQVSFLMMMVLSVAFIFLSPDLVLSLYGFRYTYMFIVLFIALSLIPFSTRDILIVKNLLVLTLTASAIFGIVLFVSDFVTGSRLIYTFTMTLTGVVSGLTAFDRTFLRFGSTFMLSHAAAPAYSLLAFWGLAEITIEKRKRGWAFFSLGVVGVLITFARAGLISMAFGLLYIFYETILKYRIKRTTLVILAILATAVAINFGLLGNNYFTSLNSGDEVRFGQLRETLDSIINYPVGHGTGTAGTSVHIASRSFYQDENADVNVSDGFYVRLLFEFGPLGVLLWGGGAILLFFHLAKSFNVTKSRALKSFFIVTNSFLLSNAFYNITSNQPEIWPTKIYLWLLLGIAISLETNNSDM
jgi:hypothetical protein